ncbi:MAG: hypothetical protein JWP18_672 [Solirubrobacterales bacterium]|nr:hypothetical protein [Solirubrobacterales bacterium]
MRRLANPAALATIVGSALLLRLVYGQPFLNYDASYSLVWAQDIANGLTPDYQGFIAPTPHPLQTFVSLLALPLGDATTHVLAWIVMLCFGGIVWVVFLLGRLLFSTPVGILSAVVILTRTAFARNAEFAYQDIPFALFVVWALLLELRTPKRGTPVLVLLTLAGVLRPEAWVLAGLYWLYLAYGSEREDRRRLAWLALLAATGPALWAISDAAITGDFLHSFHGTKDLAAQLDRPRSVFDAPYRTAQFLGFTLREPLMVGVPIGCVFVLLWARRAIVLLAVSAALLVFFIASTLGGLPLIARYVLTPTVLLAVVYAAGCLGWRGLPEGSPERRLWQRIGLVSLALSVLFVPWHLDLVDTVRAKVRNSGTIQRDLKTVADSAVVRDFYARCGRISTFDHPEVPPLRYYLDAPPGAVMDVKDPDHPLAQTLLMPIDDTVSNRYYGGKPPLTVPRGFAEVYRSDSWRLMASPACRAAVDAKRDLPGVERR